MRAGKVSAAALHVKATPTLQPTPHHCDEEAYARFLASQNLNPIWYRREFGVSG
jgi:hypothetical protein